MTPAERALLLAVADESFTRLHYRGLLREANELGNLIASVEAEATAEEAAPDPVQKLHEFRSCDTCRFEKDPLHYECVSCFQRNAWQPKPTGADGAPNTDIAFDFYGDDAEAAPPASQDEELVEKVAMMLARWDMEFVPVTHINRARAVLKMLEGGE